MKIVIRWGVGAVGAALLLWAITANFDDSLSPWEYDEAIGRHLPAAGFEYRHRSEGWGNTIYGPHAIIGTDGNVDVSGLTVLLWGDSYVEGHQVSDAHKMSTLVGQLARSGGLPVRAGAAAAGGYGLDDYYRLLPRYEKALDSLRLNVVVIAQETDLLPADSLTFTDNGYQFRDHAPPRPVWLREINLAAAWRVDSAWKLARKVAGTASTPSLLKSLRFRPGPVPAPDTEDGKIVFPGPEELEPAFSFVVSRMIEQSKQTLLFVLATSSPRIRRGRVVEEELSLAGELFREVCVRHGLPVLTMTDAFNQFHRRTGRLVTGFNHGVPGHGHFNEDGHRLIAEAIVEYLEKHASDLFTN